MEIRLATVKDMQELAVLHVSTWQIAYDGMLDGVMLSQLSVPETDKMWTHRIKVEKAPLFVAIENKRIMGFVSYNACRDPDVDSAAIGEITALYIHPIHWRKGVGEALLKHGVLALKQMGFQKMMLWVLTKNQQARKFYEAQGMVEEGGSKEEDFAGTVLHKTRYVLPLT